MLAIAYDRTPIDNLHGELLQIAVSAKLRPPSSERFSETLIAGALPIRTY